MDIDGEDLANIADIGVNWVHTFGGVDVALSGGWGRAFGDAEDDPEVWNAGMNLGYDGWTVGGSFAEQNNAGNMDGTSFDAGVSYTTGPWSFSFAYFRGENVDDEYDSSGRLFPYIEMQNEFDNQPTNDNELGLVDDLYDTNQANNIFTNVPVTLDQQVPGVEQHSGQRGNDERHAAFLLGASYALDEGVALNGYGGYFTFEEDTGDDGGIGDDLDGFIVGTGIRLSF